MSQVSLHVYDVTNSPSQKTNENIVQLNKICRDSLGLGGIFHGAVEVNGEEWSFGFCERGTGVFGCVPKENPMYTYRETIEMGITPFDEDRVEDLINELRVKWPGRGYDLLQRNCNHFCNELCERLGVGPIPAWVNRFAYMGDASLEMYIQAQEQWSALSTSVYSSSQSLYSYMFGSSTPYNKLDAQNGSAVNGQGPDGATLSKQKREAALPVCPTLPDQSSS